MELLTFRLLSWQSEQSVIMNSVFKKERGQMITVLPYNIRNRLVLSATQVTKRMSSSSSLNTHQLQGLLHSAMKCTSPTPLQGNRQMITYIWWRNSQYNRVCVLCMLCLVTNLSWTTKLFIPIHATIS